MYQNKRKWTVETVVFMGFFVAMNIVLTRFCSIELGPYRLGFGPAAIIMSGLWLGPAAGGIVGLVSDLIGCLLKGYAVNPFITVSAIVWGVLPAAMSVWFRKGSSRKITLGISVSVAAAAVLSTLVLNTAGMVVFMGYSFYAIFPGRAVQFAVMTPILCVIAVSLYLSPLTKMIAGFLKGRRART